jgi:repressor LexA
VKAGGRLLQSSEVPADDPQAGTIFCAMKTRFTEKQGQYLAFIHYYTKVNGRAPAEADMQRYFRVTPPSVHQMVLTLEANGCIERVPGQGRSISLMIPREQLPDLE